VRDGDVQVAVLRRHEDDGTGTSKLAAARQVVAEQTKAREQAERLLQEAQETIKELQTK
jgi:hypothetical protein